MNNCSVNLLRHISFFWRKVPQNVKCLSPPSTHGTTYCRLYDRSGTRRELVMLNNYPNVLNRKSERMIKYVDKSILLCYSFSRQILHSECVSRRTKLLRLLMNSQFLRRPITTPYSHDKNKKISITIKYFKN